MSKSVTIIGGGISGLSAAVFLADKDFDVTLIEASPKLGGRAYSFFDKTFGDTIDNGQHILASWYENTFNFLKLIGSYDKLTFQQQLEVKFIDENANRFLLKASKLPPPFHLLGGIMGYKALGFSDKKAMVKLVNAIKKDKFSSNELKEMNTDRLFSLTGQTDKLINNFWKPFIIAVFNAEPEDTSAYLFSNMIKMGFLKKGGSNLVLPNSFLDALYVKPSVKYLEGKNAKVLANTRVSKINFENNEVTSIILEDNTELKSDFYISTVGFFDFKAMVGESVYNRGFSIMSGLKPSPIVNIHLKFGQSIDDIFPQEFVGLLNTKVQWVFKVKEDQLCLVISAGKDIAELNKEEILTIAKDELVKCIPAFQDFSIKAQRVLKEMRATFVPDKESLNQRPNNVTNYSNFFIAGDWTNTGLPATIEGAVKSSKDTVSIIMKKVI